MAIAPRNRSRLSPAVAALVITAGVLPVALYTAAPAAAPVATGAQLIPIGSQLALVLAVNVIKPLYMALTLAGIVWLWRQATPGLAALRWGLLFFFAGESACWVNIWFFFEESVFFEYLHSFGMVAFIGFTVFAAVEGADTMLLGFGDPQAKCVLLRTCRGCAKYQPGAPCVLRRLFQWTLALLIPLAAMPLSAQPAAASVNVRVFGLLRNLSHPLPIQWYELRFTPPVAMLLLAGALAGLLWPGPSAARRGERLRPSLLPGSAGTGPSAARRLLAVKVLLAAGMGHLVFGLLRLALFAFYRYDLAWFAFWEEATELMFIASVLFVVAQFRKDLLPRLPRSGA